MRAVILAGGFGTRMTALFPDLPKPLVPIEGKAVLVRQIESLVSEGITDVTVVTHHLADKIVSLLGDGSDFGARISYFHEAQPLGTGGAVFAIRPDEDFLLINGDLVFDLTVEPFLRYHRGKNALVTLFAHPNDHPAQSTLLKTDETGAIRSLILRDRPMGYYQNLCGAGICIISPAIFDILSFEGNTDLDRDVISELLPTGRVYAYRCCEYVRDMGTPSQYKTVCADVKNGLPGKRSLKIKKKAVFLDRDGTLNVYKGFITDPSELELLPGAAEALARINAAGYLAILATNQPIIARGECDTATLCAIHDKLETLLGECGAFLDDIFFCPHHPDSGYPGEIKSLKIKCECRKPSPGMLFAAAKKYNIDLGASYMVGDTVKDVETGINAGCTGVFLRSGKDEAISCEIDCPCYADLSDFADHLPDPS